MRTKQDTGAIIRANLLFYILAAVLLFPCAIVQAGAINPGGGTAPPSDNSVGGTAPPADSSQGSFTGGLVNPLESDTISEFLFAILEIILVFAVPVVVFFIIYAGYLFVVAQGDPTKLSKARSAFTWAIVGGVIVLGATLIVNVIQSTVNAL